MFGSTDGHDESGTWGYFCKSLSGDHSDSYVWHGCVKWITFGSVEKWTTFLESRQRLGKHALI